MDHPLPGGTAKIGNRLSILAVGDQLREKSTVDDRLREKKGRRRRRGKEERRKKRRRKNTSRRPRSCVVATLAREPSLPPLVIFLPCGEKDQGD
ncbi:hypothetical protein B296_00045188, partial [Ensete ventricosum]